MKRQLDEIWNYAQHIAADEDLMPEPPTAANINQESVRATIEKLNNVLAENDHADKKVKSKLRYIHKNFPANLAKYEQQEAILETRNSYSKTDTDATFMRMKEDHMLNGQLKPGYNVQISSSNQFIVNYTIHPNPTDTTTLKAHLEQHKRSFGAAPRTLTADAGYGSEENYTLLEGEQVTAFVKYNSFDNEQSETYSKKSPFAAGKLFYNDQQDVYICPMGQQMNYIGELRNKTSTGFIQTYRRYQAKNCSNCPLNGVCHRSRGNRIIDINVNLKRLKQQAHELLNTEEGIKHRKKRCFDVEPVFANIKQNHGFRRFMLRGKEKVEIEWGLLAIAQNLRKKAA